MNNPKNNDYYKERILKDLRFKIYRRAYERNFKS